MREAPSSCGLWRGVIGGAYIGHNAWQIGACFHEDCAVAHASPIHGPGVNKMGVGTHNNIAERLVYGKCQIWVSVQRVQVVFVIVGSAVQPD